MTVATACRRCGAESRQGARFYDPAVPDRTATASHVDDRLAGLEPKRRRLRDTTGRLGMDVPETNRTLVAAAFARLSAEDRAMVRRAYYHGWTTAQIGADLGIAEGAVKLRLHHALRALQQTLQEMGVAP
jgi:DNA-directed RNA polymerase specialized sigma24 family protein